MEQGSTTARFGVFEADLKTGELRKSGRRIRLQDQPFRVLAALVGRPGELVSREELKERIWPEDTLIDFDHALTTAVKKLRRVLQDSATQPRYVETLPKRGYRFIAPVEWLENGQAAMVRSPAAGANGRLKLQRNIFAGLSVVLLGLAALAAFPRKEPAEAPGRWFTFTPPSAVSGARRAVAVSPNGRHIAYLSGRANPRLWIRNLDDREPRRLAGTEGANSPFWSLDSEFVVFGAGAALKRVSVHGGAPQTLCPLSGGVFAGGAYSPDGRWIVFSAGLPPTLYQIPAEGGTPEPLFEPVVMEGGGGNYDISFLPPDVRADTILFGAGGPARREFLARDLSTGEQVLLGTGSRPVYSKRGYVLFQAEGDEGGLWALPFSAERLTATGPAQPIADHMVEPSLANDEALVFADADTSQRTQQLIVKDRSGSLLRIIGSPQDSIGGPALSPDGRRILASGTRGGEIDVWIHEFASGAKTRVTSEAVVEADPIWSPDGQEIIYRSDRTSPTELLRLNLQNGEPVALPLEGQTKRATDWSRDGRHLVYGIVGERGTYDLWRLELTADGDGEPQPLVQTSFNETSGKLSPDGRFLAYCSDESGEYELYVTPFPTADRRWQVSSGGGCQPQWISRGRELLFARGVRLLLVDVTYGEDGEFTAGEPRELFRDRTLRGALVRNSYAATEDGSQIILRQSEARAPDEEPVSIHVVENWFSVFGERLGDQP